MSLFKEKKSRVEKKSICIRKKKIETKHTRTSLLFGEENFSKLAKSRVLLFGVGGVGSFTLDCLYRSGVENITVVDFDTYDITNLNRQLGSDGNIGKYKVDVLKEIYPKIEILNRKATVEFIENFDFSNFDLVLDAIDDIPVKVAIAQKVSFKLISSMGSAKQIDPTKIEITSIWKTECDPFAKRVRTELRKSKFQGDFQVVFSRAEREGGEKGSFVGVTGSFGLALCSKAIQTIL
jgi:tRNA A37 threonylcarbamoyladenosine dehydratase